MSAANLATRISLRTPLGWRQLYHNKSRLFVAIGGVVFANLLIFLQLGVMNALFESAVTPIRMLKADILLLSPAARAIGQLGTLPRARLYQALAVPGVFAGGILQTGNVDVRNPQNNEQASITAFGLDPSFDGFVKQDISSQLQNLKLADTAILDRLSRSALSPLVSDVTAGKVGISEMTGRTVSILGLFSLGASFQSDGSMIVSDQTFLRLFPRSSANAVSAILLQIEPGADMDRVIAELTARMPSSDTKVFSKEQYVEFVKSYMSDNTPIGFVFTFGVVIGLLVGFAIVYQILSADVNDHLREYATLKAMGYRHAYLLSVVFEEALILVVLGFLPGVALSFVLYAILAQGTELIISMPASRAALVFALTFLMCCISGAIAAWRLKAADPADNF